VRPREAAERADPRQRALLQWLATEIARGQITFERLPDQDGIPSQYISTSLATRRAVEQAQRWARMLLLARDRPLACGRVLAASLLTEGLDGVAVHAALTAAAPRLAAGEWRGRDDADYVRAELEHLAAPGFATKLSLAYAAARHEPAWAAGVAREAQRLKPDNFQADMCLGHAAEVSGQYASATDHYAAAARKGCTDCHVAWARAANRAGHPQTALTVVEQAPAFSPALVLEHARAVRVLRSPRDALQVYASLRAAATGQRNQVLAEIAECHLSLGLYREAVRTARAPAAAGEHLAMRVLAMAHYRAGNWEQAAEACSGYLGVVPEDREVWSALAWSYLMLNQHEAAVEAGSTSLRLDPHAHDAASAVGDALVRLGRYDEAIELCAQHDIDIMPYAHIARALLECGELTRASEFIGTWVKRRPGDVDAWLAMGYLAERVGRFEEACTYYAQAVHVAPDNQQARNRYLSLSEAMQERALPGPGDGPEREEANK